MPRARHVCGKYGVERERERERERDKDREKHETHAHTQRHTDRKKKSKRTPLPLPPLPTMMPPVLPWPSSKECAAPQLCVRVCERERE
jgi:hypothetical protein